jgi:cell division protein FtsN
MGVIVSRMKIEISKLTELVSILEEDMGSITEKNPEIKFKSYDSTIEQLNKKVNSLSRHLQDPSQSATETFKSKPTATVVKPAKINKSLGNRQMRIHGLEKKKPEEAAVRKVSAKKTVPVKKSKIAHPAKNWSVNLVSYKEKTYAEIKAAKFVQKGVPVKVKAVNVNKVKLYRLKVDGFKSKLDATSYASKIKKSLNLSSVSVDQNS